MKYLFKLFLLEPLEENVRIDRLTAEEFLEQYPTVDVPPGARAVYLMSGLEGTRVNVYSAHETLWDRLHSMIDKERGTLPKNVEVYLLRLDKPETLVPPGVIVADWLLQVPFGEEILRRILPLIKVRLGDRFPTLTEIVLHAIKGAEGEIEMILGQLTLQDEQGNTVYAYFV